MAGFGISTVKLCILQGVPGFKVSTAVFDSRAESDMSYIYIYIYIQGVPRVKVTTSGECSLGQTIPI
jgi:hypothetical protein